MKNYNEVVENRFNAESNSAESIYSINHPIGRYSRFVLFNKLNIFVKKYFNENEVKHSIKILDVGCGNGGMIDYFIDQGFRDINCTGIDFSKTRIERAIEKNAAINFIHDNAVTFKLDETNFNLIVTFDLFSHFNKEEDILKCLTNVREHLAADGLFLWYDIYSKNHFDSPKDAESWGFSKKQMIYFAQQSGFEVVSYHPLFKLFFNKYHSVYQVKRFPVLVVRILEKIVPGKPGNQILVLKKKINA